MKFNAVGPDGLIDRKAPGQPSLLKEAHRAALVEAIERGPIAAVHGVVRWRIIDLAQMLWDDFSLSVSRPTLSRELRALGYRKRSARPKHHAQDPDAIEAFKRGLCRRARGISFPLTRRNGFGGRPGHRRDARGLRFAETIATLLKHRHPVVDSPQRSSHAVCRRRRDGDPNCTPDRIGFRKHRSYQFSAATAGADFAQFDHRSGSPPGSSTGCSRTSPRHGRGHCR
jgi:transposase